MMEFCLLVVLVITFFFCIIMSLCDRPNEINKYEELYKKIRSKK